MEGIGIIAIANKGRKDITELFLLFQWRIQDFPEEGALTPRGGAPTYYLANFS